MRKKERYEKVIAWFQDNVPEPKLNCITTIRMSC